MSHTPKIFTVGPEKIRYRKRSEIPSGYTDKMDKAYHWMAKGYDLFMTVFPVWKKWIRSVIPYIEGERILEVSFGNGYLMTQYASGQVQVDGIDYNEQMLQVARKKIEKSDAVIRLVQGSVEKLPYADNTFDTVIDTMAFTGYPDGECAMREIKRVLKPGGKFLLVDFDYPADRNLLGYLIVRFWERMGDVMKNVNLLIQQHGFDSRHFSIGAFGSVHLFVATKKQDTIGQLSDAFHV